MHGWRYDLLQRKRRYPVRAEPHRHGEPSDPANFYEFVDVLSDAASADTTIVTDAGNAFYIMGQAFRVKEGQRYLASGSLAAMGWAMPACTGAACAAPGRTIIGVTGDGSFQTNVHELAVWREHRLPIKLFVIDNDGYACIRATQDNYYGSRHVGSSPESGVWLPPIKDIALAYDLPHVGITKREWLDPGIRRSIQIAGPVIVSVKCQTVQAIMPQVASAKLPDGSMRSGRLDEIGPAIQVEELEAAI